jgi:hypothetical protein
MSDGVASRADTEEGRSIGEEQGKADQSGIMVRTEIHVIKDQV